MNYETACPMPPDPHLLRRVVGLGLLRAVDGQPLVDSRGLLGTAEGRWVMAAALAQHLDELPDDVAIGGVANSGSIVGLLLADRLDLDYVNVLVDGPRSKGLRRTLEPEDGLLGRPVVLVDNWIATGSSLLEAARLVEDRGGFVVGVFTISASLAFNGGGFPLPVHEAFPLAGLITEHERANNR